MTSKRPLAPRASATEEGRWFTPGRAFVLLAGYFLLQTLCRVLVSDSAELDESEQLLWSQALAWGYGSDPPLYTWLQIVVFRLLGTNILGLALLKNVLLFGGFYFTYRAAEALARDKQTAALAMLSLLLFPQITWESQRDLTHSVLAAVLAPATLYLFVLLEQKPSPTRYFGLGLCLALGMLSKYSYCLFALALFAAALTVPRYRRVLSSPWLCLSLFTAALLTIPHFSWVCHRPSLAFSRPAELVRETGGWHFHAFGLALWSVVKCAVMLAGLLTAVYLVCFGRTKAIRPSEVREHEQLLTRTGLIVLLICIAVAGALALELRDRWFQPLAFLLAVGAALWAQHRVTRKAATRFLGVISLIVILMVLILPGIPLMAGKTNRPTRLNAPYSNLARQLKVRTGEPPLIIADTRLTGGNLRLWFTNSVVVAPEFQTLAIPSHGSCLVVWDANKKTLPPAPLLQSVQALRGTNLNPSSAEYLAASSKYIPRRMMRLGYVVLDK